MLIRYETLHFQSRKNPRNICDPTSSNCHNSAMLHLNWAYHSYMFRQATIQSGVCSSRRLEIICVAIWEVQFFLVTLACLDVGKGCNICSRLVAVGLA